MSEADTIAAIQAHIEDTENILRPDLGGSVEEWLAAKARHKARGCPECKRLINILKAGCPKPKLTKTEKGQLKLIDRLLHFATEHNTSELNKERHRRGMML